MTTTDDLMAWLAQQPAQCVCGQLIPDNAVYYGFPMTPESDEPMAFVNEWHEHCLGEWGWMRSDNEFGIAHRYCA